jgi:hypothetical protein
MQQFIQKTIG